MATDAIVWLHEQAMLPLQAKSLEADAGARIARIQPFWKTLSAQSRMDLLSIPIAAFKQRIAAAKAEHWAAEQKATGTKRSSAIQQGSNLLCFSCRGHVRDSALRWEAPSMLTFRALPAMLPLLAYIWAPVFRCAEAHHHHDSRGICTAQSKCGES